MATASTSEDFASESLWLGLWRYVAILGAATIESAALLTELETRSDLLESLSQALDRWMRSAEFLRLMRLGLHALHFPTYFAVRHSGTRKRVHP
jgi:predicted ferric reductase